MRDSFPKEFIEGLWAPWRVEYFGIRDHDPDFLLAAVESDDDEAHLVVTRNPGAILMLNKYPYSTGHLMAVPRRKVATLADLAPQEKLELFDLVELGQRLLADAVKARGFNIGMNIGACAGAGVPDHLHIHIVPRWPDDVNFMAVLAGVRVIPEGLRATRLKLIEALRRLPVRENFLSA